MNDQLSWYPDNNNGWWQSWAWLLIFPWFIFIPIGVWILYARYQKGPLGDEKRRKIKEATSSILMSKAEYVGGHPLIPRATTVVAGVSDTQFTIYSIDKQNLISPIASIQIRDIVRVGAGKPKTAREIYDQDHGYSIDVIEESPFLSVIFTMGEYTYAMSFQHFEYKNSPQDWSNHIVSLQHKARTESK